MRKWHNEDLLEVVEMYADDTGYISNEDELSERFDEEIALQVVEQYGADDVPAISEVFNNWSDMLCKDGDIHPIQYANYCYTGKYS